MEEKLQTGKSQSKVKSIYSGWRDSRPHTKTIPTNIQMFDGNQNPRVYGEGIDDLD